MKLKFLSFLLAITILSLHVASCGILDDLLPREHVGGSLKYSWGELETEMSEPPREWSAFETVYPEISVSSLRFSLSESDIDDFEEKLARCSELYNEYDPDETAFERALYSLHSSLAYIDTQRDIAHILYYYDLSDEEASKNYDYATEVFTKVHRQFWDFFASIRNTQTILAFVVKDFEKKEYPVILTYQGDIDSYSLQMSDIKAKFEAYNGTATTSQVHGLYTQYLEVSRKLAQAYGYENYYEYVTDCSYDRDYGKAERELLREYVKTYLVPLYKKYKSRSDEMDSHLTPGEYALSNRYLKARFDSFSENYLLDYFNSLPKSSRNAMIEPFVKDRILIADRKNSYNLACVMQIGDTPVCYFHKSQARLEDVSHEIGHYYARHANGRRMNQCSYDLMETHSQANSMLMLSFLGKKLSSNAFDSYQIFQISNMLYQAILAAIRDEFDEIVLSDPESHNFSIQQLEDIMSGLIEEYGVDHPAFGKIETQLLTYWNHVGVDRPGYYISYSMSFVVAFQIYQRSFTDYEGAVECYRMVVEEIDGQRSFLGTIEKAGLLSPLDESVYKSMTVIE